MSSDLIIRLPTKVEFKTLMHGYMCDKDNYLNVFFEQIVFKPIIIFLERVNSSSKSHDPKYMVI